MHKFLCPVLQKVYLSPQVRHIRDGFNVSCDFAFKILNQINSRLSFKALVIMLLSIPIFKPKKGILLSNVFCFFNVTFDNISVIFGVCTFDRTTARTGI